MDEKLIYSWSSGEIENFTEANLRIITQETVFLRTVLKKKKKNSKAQLHTFLKQRIIHQNGTLMFYVKFIRDTQSQQALYKASNGSPRSLPGLGKECYLLRSNITGI